MINKCRIVTLDRHNGAVVIVRLLFALFAAVVHGNRPMSKTSMTFER